MYTLKLIRGLSYCGIVTASRERPCVLVEEEELANAVVATGYFELIDVNPEAWPETEEGTVERMDTMTVKQLREYAKNIGVDLAGATKKEDILAILYKAIMRC